MFDVTHTFPILHPQRQREREPFWPCNTAVSHGTRSCDTQAVDVSLPVFCDCPPPTHFIGPIHQCSVTALRPHTALGQQRLDTEEGRMLSTSRAPVPPSDRSSSWSLLFGLTSLLGLLCFQKKAAGHLCEWVHTCMSFCPVFVHA